MGKWENKIEKYLREELEKIGGTCRKWVCPNHSGVPDQIVFFKGFICFVEAKTFDGELSSAQEREHVRLKEQGAEVFTLYSEHQVDVFVLGLKLREGIG